MVCLMEALWGGMHELPPWTSASSRKETLEQEAQHVSCYKLCLPKIHVKS